jgi:hypothetical protein
MRLHFGVVLAFRPPSSPGIGDTPVSIWLLIVFIVPLSILNYRYLRLQICLLLGIYIRAEDFLMNVLFVGGVKHL